jgi:hypothetical protein
VAIHKKQEGAMEHRCGYRRPIHVAALVRTRGGVAGKAILSEVSASGARVVATLPVAPHSMVLVQFSIHRASARPERVTIEAEVVRLTETGFALEWTEFAPQAARLLYAPRVETSANVRAESRMVQRGARR